MADVGTLPIGNDGFRELFALLFPSGAEGFVETRSIPNGPNLRPTVNFFPVAAGHLNPYRQIRGVGQHMDVYFGVAPRVRESGTKADVEVVHALWVDIDTKKSVVELLMSGLDPSAVVKTGSEGHLHAYWALSKPLDVAEAERLNKALAARLGGDPACTDASRIMRMPGTYNFKHDRPVRAELISCEGVRHEVSDLKVALAEQLESADEAKPKIKARGEANASGPVAVVLGKLDAVQATGQGWKALCPAHDDNRPSLNVTEGDDGRCLIHCFAGCEADEILRALDLEMADLFPGNPAKRVASQLVSFAEQEGLRLIQDREIPFATMTTKGRLQTWPIPSPGLERELRRVYFDRTREGLSKSILDDVIATLGARALFEGDETSVFRRIAAVGSKLVIDIGDSSGQVIEVSPEGWSLIDNPGIHFVRANDDLPWPIPERGGSIDELRALTNCASEADFKVFVGSILMCFHPTGPYPLIYIRGEQGSAKSTHSRLLASLADPRSAPLSMGRPRARDLIVTASGVRLLGFDNVSLLRREFSDALCQLATGAGHRTRQLYTDAEQSIVEARIAVHLNGVGNPIKRPDLQERTGVVNLKPIPPEERRTEEEFLEAFEAARPRIFGALLDGLSSALANRATVKLDGYPRMADFALWVEAAAPAFGWKPGEFAAALARGQGELVEDTIDGHPEIEALLRYIDEFGEFDGTAQELLALLGTKVRDEEKGRYWPTQPDQLTKRMDEFAPVLRAHGVGFRRDREGGGNRVRRLHVYRIGDAGTRGDA